jgi:hypothetical protein
MSCKSALFDYSSDLVARIAPRRSPVRVRLAPLAESMQISGFGEAGAWSEAPIDVGLWPDLWPGRPPNGPLEFAVHRYFMRFRGSNSAQSRGLNGTFSECSGVRAGRCPIQMSRPLRGPAGGAVPRRGPPVGPPERAQGGRAGGWGFTKSASACCWRYCSGCASRTRSDSRSAATWSPVGSARRYLS